MPDTNINIIPINYHSQKKGLIRNISLTAHKIID